jgi:hypothetical protein
MDFNIVLEHFELIVLLACLVIGYIIKHASFLKKIKNNDIPVILAVFGAITNAVVNGVSVESIVYGAVMGLSSTGLHQAFKTFVEKKNN